MLQIPDRCTTTTCPETPRPSLSRVCLAPLRTALAVLLAGYNLLKAASRRRSTCRMLSELPDHRLKDIGIHRSRIREAVWAQERERARSRVHLMSGWADRL